MKLSNALQNPKLFAAMILAASALFSSQCFSQNLNPLAKVEKDVVELVRKGPQTVLLTLEVGDVINRQSDKRKALKSQYQSSLSEDAMREERRIAGETKVEYDNIKHELFPEGKHGQAIIKEDFSHSATLAIEIPNYATLIELASNPRVKSIASIRVPVPAGSSNLYI